MPIVLCASIIPDVPAFSVRLCVLARVPFTVPPKVIAPPAGVPPLFVVSTNESVPASVTAVPASPNTKLSPLVRNCPFRVTPEGAVAVTPPSNNSTSPAASPNWSVPVLLKVTAFVIVAPPVSETLYPRANVVKSVAVTLPCRLTAPVAPALFSWSESVPIPVPMFPVTVIVPLPDLSVTFSAVPPATPVIEATEILPAPVFAVSSTRFCPDAIVTLPNVIF